MCLQLLAHLTGIAEGIYQITQSTTFRRSRMSKFHGKRLCSRPDSSKPDGSLPDRGAPPHARSGHIERHASNHPVSIAVIGWKFIGRRKKPKALETSELCIDDLRCSWMDSYYKVDIKKPSASLGPTRKGWICETQFCAIIALNGRGIKRGCYFRHGGAHSHCYLPERLVQSTAAARFRRAL